ncbi:Mss4-like protein [Glarea lozoyensis ATCC 20868]|uniref:Mss4-like protein n=1 Tax=Glarea lozoyensis (strain ATCC 20868 / MF5171) TaxID=1116229 RepID=S3D5K3_GLAL2|nr:Mss4-like protein [Glarea lozoyensis ATCC 20868]EPE27356.1 Mss4-like protein [Glarea lozoyensis ATCC 20868]
MADSIQKFFGTNYGLTTKIPASAFNITQGTPKVHEADNGSGSLLHREFCSECGGGILEYGEQAKNDFRYVMYGTIDNSEGLDPKGEFFCRYRNEWMPEIPDIFHKQKIQE